MDIFTWRRGLGLLIVSWIIVAPLLISYYGLGKNAGAPQQSEQNQTRSNDQLRFERGSNGEYLVDLKSLCTPLRQVCKLPKPHDPPVCNTTSPAATSETTTTTTTTKPTETEKNKEKEPRDTKCMPEVKLFSNCVTNDLTADSQEHRLAIIVPFRDRYDNLQEFLDAMYPYLGDQKIYFHTFVIEQTFTRPFNRAKLMNIGFNLTNEYFDYYCFHDVDCVPVEYINYGYPTDKANHLAINVEKLGWGIGSSVGGVLCMNKEQMLKTNGMSNQFFGWGGEDDDLGIRLHKAGIEVWRPPSGRYHSLAHKNNGPNHADYQQNLNVLHEGAKHMYEDGLNNLDYTINHMKLDKRYVLYNVDL